MVPSSVGDDVKNADSAASAVSTSSDSLRLCTETVTGTTSPTPDDGVSSGNSNTPPVSKLPVKQLFVLSCVLLSEGFGITMLFPFVPFMVRDFNVAESEADLGYYVAAIAGSFSIAQFLSSFLWGRASDHPRIGRRPVLLAGLFGSFVSMAAFGFSTSLGMAIATRSLNGLLNGNIGIAKSYLSEITDETTQAKAFSVIGLVWGVGSFFGPVVGGMLARPAVNYPNTFSEDSFFGRWPYALPCLVAASVTLVGFFTGLFFLPESHPKKLARQQQQKAEKKTTKKNGKGKWTRLQNMGDDNSVDDDDDDVDVELGRVQPAQHDEAETASVRTLLSDHVVRKVCFAYAILGLTYVMMDEVFPLWAMTDVSRGGVNFSTTDIGIIVAVGGISLLGVQLFCYARIVARMGYIRSWRTGLVVAACVFPIIPMTHVFHDNSWLLRIVLCLIMILRNTGGVVAFTSVAIMINHSVKEAFVGSVNGLGQSLVALFRAIAPFAGGSLYAWSARPHGTPFPFNYYLVFLIGSLLTLLCMFITFNLPVTINARYVDDGSGGSGDVAQNEAETGGLLEEEEITIHDDV